MKDFVDDSLVLRLFKEEREEILRHKWVLSERAGKDVGYYVAMHSWLMNHKQQWLESQVKKLGITTSISGNKKPES